MLGSCERLLEKDGPERAQQGASRTLFVAFWAHLRSVYSLWAPCGDRGVNSCRYVGLTCHLGPKILVRTTIVCRKCLFSWTWVNLLQDVGPLILVLA